MKTNSNCGCFRPGPLPEQCVAAGEAAGPKKNKDQQKNGGELRPPRGRMTRNLEAETNHQFIDLSKPRHPKSTARSTAKRVLATLRPTATKARLITKHCSVVKFELRLKSDLDCPEKIAHTGSAVQLMDFLIFRKTSPKKKSENFQNLQVNRNRPWFCLIPEGRGGWRCNGGRISHRICTSPDPDHTTYTQGHCRAAYASLSFLFTQYTPPPSHQERRPDLGELMLVGSCSRVFNETAFTEAFDFQRDTVLSIHPTGSYRFTRSPGTYGLAGIGRIKKYWYIWDCRTGGVFSCSCTPCRMKRGGVKMQRRGSVGGSQAGDQENPWVRLRHEGAPAPGPSRKTWAAGSRE